MPFKCNSHNPDLAQFLLHCGVAVNMWYGPDASGSQTDLIEDALTDYFKYNADYAAKSNYNDQDWADLIKNEIDNKRPIVYAGSDDNGGHAWNCDGYIDDEFHMNWGWGGNSDGYYALDHLVAGGYNFNQGFEIIYNIYPLGNYPEHCTGLKQINGVTGSFDDGSGNEMYQNDNACYYLIQPDCGSQVDFAFDIFQIDSNDYVNIYDGASTDDPLIATYYGNQQTDEHSTYGGAMLIEFVTDGSSTDIGWYASYTTKACGGIQTLNDASGTITDGSGPCEYGVSTYCRWEILPDNADSISLDFSSFNLSEFETLTSDYVKIYKDTITNGNEIASFTYDSPPTDTIIVPFRRAWIRFASNTSNNGQGWEVNYNSYQSSGINNIDGHSDIFSVTPNPFISDAKVSFIGAIPNKYTISVTDITGKIVGSKSIQNRQPNSMYLSEITPNLKQGIYFVILESDKSKTIQKVISYK